MHGHSRGYDHSQMAHTHMAFGGGSRHRNTPDNGHHCSPYFPVAYNHEFFAQILADVAILVALLYFSGGPTNPFIALLLLPLVITVATLPKIYGWSMAAITVLCYSGLMASYVPLPLHALATYEMKLHIWGMWFEFIIIAGAISYFVKRMSDSLQERDQAIAHAREEN